MIAYASGSLVLTLTPSERHEAASNNDAMARLRELRDAIARCRSAARERRVSDAQSATKYALEALHELEDDRRKRHEWSQEDWTSGQREEWTALMGIRNAAHHLDLPAVILVGGSAHTPSEDDLRWTTSPLAIKVDAQAQAFADRLAGTSVLPALDDAAARIATALEPA